MSKPSYANIVCTTSSANNVVGTSAEPIFDSDHGSVVFSSDISDDIIYAPTAGTLTFKKAGTYHIVANLITGSDSGTNTHTVTFNLNSDSAIYTGAALVPAAFDPISHTHQRIITVSANDVLHVKIVASANNIGIVAGTSLVVNRVTSGVFASSTVTTAGSNNTTAEFNPLDTDGDGPAFASAGKIASGVTFTENAGSMTVPSAGRYFIMVSNFIGVGGTTNSNVVMHLKEGSNEVYTATTRPHVNTDVAESTICVIEDLAADAVLTITYDIGSGNCFAAKGTTFTVYKLNEDVQNLNETLDINSASICVVNKATSTATAVEVSPFDEGGYSSDDFDTRYSNDMTHTTSTGVFQPLFEGKYWIFYSGYLTIASDDDVVTKLKHNDTVILEGSAKIDSLDDPHNRSYTTVIDCRRTDTLSVTVDSDGQDIQIQPGTSFTVVRLSDWAIGETTPAESVNARDDYKIDSFGQLSKQHRRHTDQVPFVLATPGPLSLRQRNSAAIITAGTSDES